MDDIIKHIKGLSADSRKIRPGYLFAALPGSNIDGCQFIGQAIDNGATHILVPKGTQVDGHAVVIESDHPRRDFARLAALFYNAQPAHNIAVTGTNGKTSVVNFIRQIWDLNNVKCASLGTLGLISNHIKGDNVMTTPDPVRLHELLADLKVANIDHLALEASSHGLDQHRLDGVNIKIAAFTNLSQDHLDYHGTMNNYFTAKKRLFDDLLPDDGIAIINIDDEWGRKIHRSNMITFGMDEHADLRLIKQTPTAEGQDLSVEYDNKTYNIHLPLIGLFQAYNVLCAAACCMAGGMNADTVFGCLDKLNGIDGRLQQAASINNKTAYIDYAHTPDGLEQVLKALRPHTNGRLIVVFGAGGDRDTTKRPKMGRIANDMADIAIVTDDNPRGENASKIRDEIMATCPDAMNIGDRRQAIIEGVKNTKDGDILLVAGKGHEQGQIIGDQVIPFDDLIETKQAMEAYA